MPINITRPRRKLSKKDREILAKYLCGTMYIAEAARHLKVSHQVIYTICTALLRDEVQHGRIEASEMLLRH